MVDFCVFNELSLPLNEHKAKDNFGVFFKLLKELRDKNLNKIRMSDDFKDYYIVKNTTFYNFTEQQKDRDFKNRLKSFIGNSIIKIDTPIIKPTEKRQDNAKNMSEYFFDNISTDGGLACCDIWDTIAISFNIDEKWNKSNISLQKKLLNENADITTNTILIRHASNIVHLTKHKDFFDNFEKELKLDIKQNNFWEKKKINFSNKIEFCEEVKDSIKKLDDTVFKSAISILRDIETNCKKPSDFNFSVESKSVKNNPKMRSCRMFTIGNEKYFFENHIKSLPNGNRIYFLEQNNKIYIGYIGKHLQTATN